MSTARTGRMTSGIAAVVAAAAVLILLSVFMPSFSYASSTCSIQIDGVTIPSDADPIVEDGTTLVPIGVISGYLGGTSDWNSQTETATVKNGDVTIVMTIGSTTATVNGEKKTLTLAPRITTVNEQGGGRTMVPLRFIAEAFGYDVDWDAATRTALINTTGASEEPAEEPTEEPSEEPSDDPQESLMTIASTQILSGQTYNGESGYTLVQITSTQSLASGGYSGTKLSGPYRYYIDFASATLGSSALEKKTLDVDNSYVSAVRTGITDGKVRVVCDLKADVTPSISYSSDGKTMILAFPETYQGTNSGTGSTGGGTAINGYNPYADGQLVVCIDPGHGLTTGGKRSPDGSLREYEFNRDVAYRLKALLEARGVTCIMTVAQDDQTDPSLATRVAIANNAGNVDLFVSIHANAFGDGWNSANGWEVYTYQSGGIAEMAAKAVEQATIDSGAGLKNRGCKTANFYVIKNTTMPAILIEHGFYTNLEECEKLKSDSFRDILAQADANGIMNFFSLFQ